MALPFYNWSRAAASNATADSTVNWAEGQAPSSVNDSARAMMASTAAFRDDISGAIATSGGSTAYTVSSYQVFDTLAHLNGQMVAFVPHTTSTNAIAVDVTLNVDGLGAKSVRTQVGVALPGGTLVQGTPYLVTYNNSDGVFYLQNMTNPYSVPLGGMLDYIGSSAPNTAFVLPIGQAISRTTYATLFSLISTTYGTGDGSTTFNVPDLTGRVSAMKEATATRLTTAAGGIDGGTLGAVGGAQNVTLAAGQIPSLTSVNASQSISITSAIGNIVQTSGGVSTYSINTANSGAILIPNTSGAFSGSTSITSNNSISVAYTNGSQTVTKTVMPAIILNKILRVI